MEEEKEAKDEREHSAAPAGASGWSLRSEAQAAVTHPKVEAVEGGVEVVPGPQAVHLEGHLSEEETQEDKLCRVCAHSAERHCW